MLKLLSAAFLAIVLAPLIAHADLQELIQENQNPTAVVVPVPRGDRQGQSEDGYGLMLEPQSELVQRLFLKDPTKLENDWFTVVENEDSTPLPVTDFDGRNVLFHLTKAAQYYSKLAQE